MKRPLVLIATMLLLALAACQPGGTATIAPTATPEPPTPTATPEPLTPTTTPEPPTPTATPEPLTGSGGGRIVFCSRRGEGDYEVFAMNADGTDKRQLTHDNQESEVPIWSPDGTQIAYNLDNYAGRCDLYVIDADGTDKRRLTTDGNSGYAAWSPDGTQIVFSRYAHNSSDLYVMTSAGGNEQRLTRTGKNGVFGPSWSPDGTHIVCVVDLNPDPTAEDLALYVLDVEDALQSEGATIADMQPLPQADERLNDRPDWSPDGTQIAFSAAVGYHRDIYVVNADGTGLRQLTNTTNIDEHVPAWSPDGTQIAFQANPDGNWDIYVMDADGSNRRQLTTDVANDTSPSWVP